MQLAGRRNWSIKVDYSPHIRLWLINFCGLRSAYYAEWPLILFVESRISFVSTFAITFCGWSKLELKHELSIECYCSLISDLCDKERYRFRLRRRLGLRQAWRIGRWNRHAFDITTLVHVIALGCYHFDVFAVCWFSRLNFTAYPRVRNYGRWSLVFQNKRRIRTNLYDLR